LFFIRRPIPFLVLTFAMLGLSGCQEAPVKAAALKPVEKRKPAPDFTLKDADGRTVQLSSYKGKVVLLNFWATWCGPCKIEIPWFVEFQQKYQDKGFAVLGVSMDDEGWDVVKPYIAQHKVNYRILLGNDLVAEQYGGVDSLPTTFLLDQQLRIASIHVGLVSKDVYEKEIRELLGAAAQGSANDAAAGGRNPRAD
jgi:peroxiredoxin